MAEKKPFQRIIDPDDQVILVWAVVPAELYETFKFPDRCYATAVKAGKAGDFQHKMHCAHWGITIGKALNKLGQNLVAHLPKSKIINPLDG